ncbi:hypothetical protein SAMN05443665_101663 [Actinomadura meyerae]|uniref:Vitamin K-dependent gamma-carboxylase n=1 Tax=Actinomadura meyerae TaxID=240840 RepID=A0A239JXY2_9ACTN|nr:hypothetical protein [Actinomadura meyerae]SNT10625.1 hypothetical protein SAMN05443665_101663 [Actinomadura meyerae]
MTAAATPEAPRPVRPGADAPEPARNPWDRWWFGPVPRARIAWLRVIGYVFLPFDMLLLTGSTLSHARLPADLYQPVLVGRLLHLPAPTLWSMYTLLVVTVASGLVAMTGKVLPRASGYVAACGYLWWVTISMSYGKVDHDHLALIVALFVLPSVGRAGVGDARRCEASAWSVRCVQIGVVAAYFLSAWAKVRIGGFPAWPNGSTVQWALSRRGTPIGRALIDYSVLLKASQWFMFLAEALSPVMLFLRGRPLYALVLFFAGFHAVTYALMTIHFLPHAIWLAAFLPLERLTGLLPERLRGPEPAAGPASGSVG